MIEVILGILAAFFTQLIVDDVFAAIVLAAAEVFLEVLGIGLA